MLLCIANLLRLAAYSYDVDGWKYITRDGETQAALLLSFIIQVGMAVASWFVCTFLKAIMQSSTNNPMDRSGGSAAS